jgi:hypothetical protein
MRVSWQSPVTSVNAANYGTIVLSRLATSQNASQKAIEVVIPLLRDGYLAPAGASWADPDAPTRIL